MRGSVYYQTSILLKYIFKEGSKKVQRVDKNSYCYKKLGGYGTAESYRKIWNNLGNYIFEVYGVKDFEKVTEKYIIEFMNNKILNDVSHQYLQKISSAIGKLEDTLNIISIEFERGKEYSFQARLKLVRNAKKYKLTKDNYRNRAYESPKNVINLLENIEFKVAANIQLFGGARSEGVCLIKKSQLHGFEVDEITNEVVGVIQTKEKGGKVGFVYVEQPTYHKLADIIDENGIFTIDYNNYTKSIRNSCRVLGIKGEGTHAFRWSFAQKRVVEYQNNGYSYLASLAEVSREMKHVRPEITCRYTYTL